MDAKVNKGVVDQPNIESEALFMSIGDGAIVTDEMAHISRVNQTALEILGYQEDELIGKWFPEALVIEDESGNEISNIDRPMSRAFLTGKNVSAKGFYRRKDGSSVPVSLNVSPVLVNSKPVGAIEVFRDISREVALEQAKDEFVAVASHQLRTPATAVKQYLGLLLEGYGEPLTEDQRLFLERAYESNERQLQIVHEILKISQLDLHKVVFRPALQDVNAIVRQAANSLQAVFKSKNQSLILKLPLKPVLASVDKDQLLTAVENLLENASNYTWKGKQVTASTRQLKNNVKITIKDQGVGINREDLPKLFQKFSRIPNPLSLETSGTGLGLYWATKIVELHEGEIQVETEPGTGSSFSICLPQRTQI